MQTASKQYRCEQSEAETLLPQAIANSYYWSAYNNSFMQYSAQNLNVGSVNLIPQHDYQSNRIDIIVKKLVDTMRYKYPSNEVLYLQHILDDGCNKVSILQGIPNVGYEMIDLQGVKMGTISPEILVDNIGILYQLEEVVMNCQRVMHPDTLHDQSFTSSSDYAASSSGYATSSTDSAIGSSELAIGSPDVEISSPDVVISSPDVVISSPDVEISSPDVVMQEDIQIIEVD